MCDEISGVIDDSNFIAMAPLLHSLPLVLASRATLPGAGQAQVLHRPDNLGAADGARGIGRRLEPRPHSHSVQPGALSVSLLE